MLLKATQKNKAGKSKTKNKTKTSKSKRKVSFSADSSDTDESNHNMDSTPLPSDDEEDLFNSKLTKEEKAIQDFAEEMAKLGTNDESESE